jgi:SAM-dependent methyltransferase
MDDGKLEAFMDKAMADMAGAATLPMVLLGARLGCYRKLKRRAMTAGELAKATGTFPRYVLEWAQQQAARGYLEYDAASARYRLPPAQAYCLTNDDSPLHLFAVSEFVAAVHAALERTERNFRTGQGMHWGEHHPCLFHAPEYFNRGVYLNEIVSQWMPALGLAKKLGKGIDFADVGCGHGLTTMILARAYPNSRFVGFDNHPASIATATRKAERAGLDKVRFELADATNFPGRYDVIACFECFHDMGDPAGVARRAKAVLKRRGQFVVIDPNAGDRPEDNLTPLGRLFYTGSTVMCCPASRALGGPALGAQAGPRRTARAIREGGFAKVEVRHRTPLFMLLAAAA